MEITINKCSQCMFAMISSWKQVWPFVWTNLNPFTIHQRCQVWLNLSFIIVNKVNYFGIFSCLERAWLLIWINLNYLYQKAFCPVIFKLGQLFIEKMTKCENVKQQQWKRQQRRRRRRTIDKFRSVEFGSAQLKYILFTLLSFKTS